MPKERSELVWCEGLGAAQKHLSALYMACTALLKMCRASKTLVIIGGAKQPVALCPGRRGSAEGTPGGAGWLHKKG